VVAAGHLQLVLDYASHGNLRDFLRTTAAAAAAHHHVSTATDHATDHAADHAAAAAAADGLLSSSSSLLSIDDQCAGVSSRQLLSWSCQVAAGMQHLASLNVRYIDLLVYLSAAGPVIDSSSSSSMSSSLSSGRRHATRCNVRYQLTRLACLSL